MTVHNRFISNNEAAPIIETNIFNEQQHRRFALVAFGKGLQEEDPLFQSYLQLRANVYVKQTGILSEEALRNDGTEIDEDDDRSSHFLVLENRLGSAAAVSCIRFIEKTEENPAPLPIEEFFPEVFADNPASLGSLEVSRFMSRLDDSHQQLMAIGQLFCSGLARIRQEKLGPAYAIIEEELVRPLSFMGATPDPIASPKHVDKYNSDNIGVIFDVDKIAETMGADRIDALNVQPGSVRYWGRINHNAAHSNLPKAG